MRTKLKGSIRRHALEIAQSTTKPQQTGLAVFKCSCCNQTKPATAMLKIKGQASNFCKDCFGL